MADVSSGHLHRGISPVPADEGGGAEVALPELLSLLLEGVHRHSTWEIPHA